MAEPLTSIRNDHLNYTPSISWALQYPLKMALESNDEMTRVIAPFDSSQTISWLE